MREAYHQQLNRLADELATMCAMDAVAMERATRALLDTDLALAEEVISGDVLIDEARSRSEEHAGALLALQAPVATDLRVVITALHAAESLERMGDLALHVAEAARRRHPHPVLPEQVRDDFARMGEVAVRLARKAEQVIRTRDLQLVRELEREDDEMDALHKHLFSVLMDREWVHGVAAAVDVSLLSRFYERFADHAVSVARRMEFVVTGKRPSSEG
ncbi:MAG TPA: phosphate signaling complex protein PhoU [Pseudonocardiaceae bacterium]